MNTTIALKKPDLFRIVDPRTDETYYGGNQEWYRTAWQRYTGCGPTVAATIFHYMHQDMHRADETHAAPIPMCRERFTQLMEEVWEYVTPTRQGIPSTAFFGTSALSYIRAKELPFGKHDILDCTTSQGDTSLADIVGFLRTTLGENRPVAFLNLCNGSEPRLDKWHWVTVTSLSCDPAATCATIRLLDEGKVKEADIALWHRTTTCGGGFVAFARP